MRGHALPYAPLTERNSFVPDASEAVSQCPEDVERDTIPEPHVVF